MSFNPNKNPAYIILYAVIISSVFTGGIMLVHQAAKGTIARNERVFLQRSIVELFFADQAKAEGEQIEKTFRTQITERPVSPGSDLSNPNTPRYYFAFREQASPGDPPFAVAIPVAGMGFWAEIRGYLAVDLDTQTCLGVVFTQHGETPGLGGRISEATFRDQFPGCDLTAPPAGVRWIYIDKEPVKDATDKRTGRHVDAISGATNTSTAVAHFLNADLTKRLADAIKQAKSVRRTTREAAN